MEVLSKKEFEGGGKEGWFKLCFDCGDILRYEHQLMLFVIVNASGVLIPSFSNFIFLFSSPSALSWC